MNIIRLSIAVAAGMAAREIAPKRHKNTAAVVVGVLAYGTRIGAEPGEATWPWDIDAWFSRGGTARPSGPVASSTPLPGTPIVIEVDSPEVVSMEEYLERNRAR